MQISSATCTVLDYPEALVRHLIYTHTHIYIRVHYDRERQSTFFNASITDYLSYFHVNSHNVSGINDDFFL
jgi:hypothetical protein